MAKIREEYKLIDSSTSVSILSDEEGIQEYITQRNQDIAQQETESESSKEESPIVYDKGQWAIAKEEITDDQRLIALSVLSYMNIIKRKVESSSLEDL